MMFVDKKKISRFLFCCFADNSVQNKVCLFWEKYIKILKNITSIHNNILKTLENNTSIHKNILKTLKNITGIHM